MHRACVIHIVSVYNCEKGHQLCTIVAGTNLWCNLYNMNLLYEPKYSKSLSTYIQGVYIAAAV